MAKARELMNEGKGGEAVEILEELLREEKEPLAWFVLGTWYFQAGKKDRASNAFEEAVRLVPVYPAAYRNLGKVHFALGNHAGAAGALRKAVSQGPAGPDLFFLLGQSYASLGMNLPAIETFRRLLVLDPEKTAPRAWLALVLLRAGNAAEAERVCARSMERDPGGLVLWELRANALLLQGKYEEAVDLLESLRRLGKAGPEAMRTLGDLHFRDGDFGEAARAYESSFAGREPDAEDSYRLALALFESGEGKRALAWCLRFMNTEPAELRGFLLRAKILARENDAKKAMDAYQKALEMDPSTGEAVLGIAGLSLVAGDMPEARRRYRRLVSMEGFEAKGYAGLAEVAIREERYEEALESLDRALEYDPGNSAVYHLVVELRKVLREE